MVYFGFVLVFFHWKFLFIYTQWLFVVYRIGKSIPLLFHPRKASFKTGQIVAKMSIVLIYKRNVRARQWRPFQLNFHQVKLLAITSVLVNSSRYLPHPCSVIIHHYSPSLRWIIDPCDKRHAGKRNNIIYLLWEMKSILIQK